MRNVRPVILIGSLMWLAYAVALDRYLISSGEDPMLIIYGGDPPRSILDLPRAFEVLHIALVSSAAAMVVAGAVHLVRRRSYTRAVIAGLLVLPFAVLGAGTLRYPLIILACVPTSLFGLWAVHRMQRYRRMPIRVPLAAFGWGALVAAGFAASIGYLFRLSAQGFITGLYGYPTTPSDAAHIDQDTSQAALLFAGLGEETAKAAGVAVVCILFRHHIDGMVSGIVVGAACGLGFNLTETISYMAVDESGAAHQYFMRQSVGLFAAHTAFAAVAGAGIGAARQLTERRALVVAGGLLAAIGAHALSNAAMSWYGTHGQRILSVGTYAEALVVQPALLVVLQGPVVATYLLLLRQALRTQAAGIGPQLRAEVRAGSPAITETEVPVLLNPAQRFWLRVRLLRRHGLAAWHNSGRLHQAQLDLATQRWHHARLEADDRTPDLTALRTDVVLLKRRQAAIHAAAGAAPGPAEVPA